MTIYEGNDIYLNCSATASPVPTYEWIRYDGEMPTAISGGNTSLLLISNATIEVSGAYACVASNYGGSSQSHAVLVLVLPIYGKVVAIEGSCLYIALQPN